MDSKTKLPIITFFGAQVSDINQAQTIAKLKEFIESDHFHHVMTPNTEMIMRARRDPAFRDLLIHADMAPADGMGLVWAARFLFGDKTIERIAGADLVMTVVKIAADADLPILLINRIGGLDDDSAAKAAKILSRRYPKLKIMALRLNPEDHLPEEIIKFKPAIILVGLGAPAQDFWVVKHHASIPSLRLAMGVGGSFDFIVGIQKRAPLGWQRAGLEWLWRLIHQPKRLRRQMAIPHFMWQILLIKLKIAHNQPCR